MEKFLPFQQFDTLEEVANYMKIESSKLKATLDEYNEYAHSTVSKVIVHFAFTFWT